MALSKIISLAPKQAFDLRSFLAGLVNHLASSRLPLTLSLLRLAQSESAPCPLGMTGAGERAFSVEHITPLHCVKVTFIPTLLTAGYQLSIIFHDPVTLDLNTPLPPPPINSIHYFQSYLSHS